MQVFYNRIIGPSGNFPLKTSDGHKFMRWGAQVGVGGTITGGWVVVWGWGIQEGQDLR